MVEDALLQILEDCQESKAGSLLDELDVISSYVLIFSRSAD